MIVISIVMTIDIKRRTEILLKSRKTPKHKGEYYVLQPTFYLSQ